LDAVSVNNQHYRFDYENIPCPATGSYAKDHFGYYNGAYNNSPLPAVKRNGQTIGGNADRLVDPQLVKMAMLKKITYPTGGFTEFTFEPNTYYAIGKEVEVIQTTPVTLYGNNSTNGSAVEKTVQWPLPDIKESEYDSDIEWDRKVELNIHYGTILENPNDETSGPASYIKSPRFQLSKDSKLYSDIAYTSADEGYYNYNTELYYQQYSTEVLLQSFIEPYSYDILLRTSTDERNFIKAEITRRGKKYSSTAEDIIYLPGLRIKQIKTYNEQGAHAYSKVYDYRTEDDRPETSVHMVTGSVSLLREPDRLYLDEYIIDKGMPSGTNDNWDDTMTRLIVKADLNPTFGDGMFCYKRVTENSLDKDGEPNGKVVSEFTTSSDYVYFGFPQIPKTHYNWQRGQPKKIQYYTYKNESFTKVKNEQYEYRPSTQGKLIKGLVAAYNRSYYYDQSGSSIPGEPIYKIDRYAYNFFYQTVDWDHLAKKTTTEFKFGHSFTTSEDFEYYLDEEHQLLKKKSVKLSDRSILNTEYVYSFQLPELFENNTKNNSIDWSFIHRQKEYDIINPIVETLRYKVYNGDTTWVSAVLNTYQLGKPIQIYTYLPAQELDNDFQKLENVIPNIDNRYQLRKTFGYDANNIRINKVVEASGLVVSYLWADCNQYPIAKITGNFDEAEIRAMIDQDILNANPTDSRAVLDELEVIRINFPQANITTYTYEPGVGLSSITDPNNQTIYYQYDGFGRLERVVDGEGNTLQQHQYKYLEPATTTN
jgi:YD repeat-containing protein